MLQKVYAQIVGGKQDWDNNYYDIIKGETEDKKTYNSFIKDVVVKLDKITLKGDSYTCTTCNVDYKK